MILQALYEYYQRKAADPNSGIAPEGWEWKPIPFIVIIDSNGKFLQLKDTRESVGERMVPKQYLLPRGMGRSGSDSWKVANLFWDHYGYVFGVPKDDKKKSKEMAQKQLGSFIKRLQGLPDEVKKIPDVFAVLNYYKRKEYSRVSDEEIKKCLRISGCNLTFHIDGHKDILTENLKIKTYVNSLITSAKNVSNDDYNKESSSYEAVCLITGQKGLVMVKHGRTSINKDTKSLVAIQKNSGYDSYGKEQAFNCPVSPSAEFAYTTALNTLLKSKDNRIQVADTSVVFWAQKEEKEYDFESDFPWYFKTDKDDPNKGVKAVQNLYEAVHAGRFPLDEGNRFYVLGLSPNSARISVRFWKTGTIRNFAEKIKEHFDDLDIIKPDYETPYCTINELLAATSAETNDIHKTNRVYFKGKYYDVPPNLAGAVVISILGGSPYPATLLQRCICRIRAEAAKKDQNGRSLTNVTRVRAAILKAYINRFNRFCNPKEREVLMALDVENRDVGYLLGRLFAILERAQIQSAGGEGKLNATIRDRFYGAFSSSPMTVMPILLKLKNHHLAKMESGKVFFEGLIGQVIDGINAQEIPAHLSLNKQAQFAVGYYHQRQDFFKKKNQTI